MTDTHIDLDVTEVKRLLDTGEIVLIDCREEAERQTACIDGSLWLPLSRWEEVAGQLQSCADRRIAVHCHHGGRSLRVTRWMRENGYPQTQNMAGGIDAWSREIDDQVPIY